MFSEQMRYILYFDQYQCRFGGCTHAACHFSAYYSITAVVSACAFAGFEKKCALSVCILYIFGGGGFTSAPRSSAYRCISFCTINFVHLISTRTRYEMPERPELMYLFFVAVKSGKLKQKYNLPFSLLALAGKGGKGKVWWTRAAETIHQSSAHPSPLRRRNTTKRLNAYRNSKNATCATASLLSNVY